MDKISCECLTSERTILTDNESGHRRIVSEGSLVRLGDLGPSCCESRLSAHFKLKEWLHAHIMASDRGVPCEVLEGVVGCDGDGFVRGRYL